MAISHQKMEKVMRVTHFLGITALLFCLAGTPSLSSANDEYSSLKRFSNVLDMVEKSYVEDVDREELIKGAIEGMLKNLDPHSSFLDKDAFQNMQVETEGEFTGVGIEITTREDRLTVVSPIEGTPAYEAGLKAGDTILRIDDEPTRDISLMDAVNKIRGPKGSEVDLTILHEGDTEPKTVSIERDVIPMRSVEAKDMGEGYRYIRISNFNQQTGEDLRQELTQQDNLEGVILDLRNNPGGVLEQAIEVADTFLSEGKIVYTEGRVQSSQMSFSAEPQEDDIHVPMVVLVNSGTASGAEIVAGALQDHKRGIVVGQQSFGKGSVQTVIPMRDETGIKLTTARYYTPEGNSIQARGIVPDISIPLVEAREEERRDRDIMREEDLPGHLFDEEREESPVLPEDEELREMLREDNQLRVGYELVKSLPRIREIQ